MPAAGTRHLTQDALSNALPGRDPPVRDAGVGTANEGAVMAEHEVHKKKEEEEKKEEVEVKEKKSGPGAPSLTHT